MAKKVRRKPDEDAEEQAFEFPVFDEAAFASKEFLLTTAIGVGAALAVVLGAFCWVCTSSHLPWYVPFPIAFLVSLLSPWVLGAVVRGSTAFTTGDWAGVVALEFFGFLAVWFVLVNVGL